MIKINLQKKQAETRIRKARLESFDLSVKWGIVVTLILVASLLATLEI